MPTSLVWLCFNIWLWNMTKFFFITLLTSKLSLICLKCPLFLYYQFKNNEIKIFFFSFFEINKMVWRVSSTFSCDGLNEVCMDASLCSSRCLNLFMNNPFAFWSIVDICLTTIPLEGQICSMFFPSIQRIRSVHPQSLQRNRSVPCSINPFRGSDLFINNPYRGSDLFINNPYRGSDLFYVQSIPSEDQICS